MKRENVIDILKCLAVLCVVNSHMDACYPGKLSVLATGGALGDSLFFFCSGYTLFLKGINGFLPWCWRRLLRIAPPVIICCAVVSVLFGQSIWRCMNGYWFIKCILIYYVVIYAVRRWFLNRLHWVFVGVCALILFWFYCIFNHKMSLYGGDYIMWVHYFIPMLLGMALGLRRMENRLSGQMNIFAFFISMAVHYTFAIITYRVAALRSVEWISLPFLWSAVYFLYGFAKCEQCVRVLGNGVVRWAVMLIGGICLEVYLLHGLVLTTRLNGLFPLNIPLLFLGVILVAFFAKKAIAYLISVFGAICRQIHFYNFTGDRPQFGCSW